VFETGNHRKFGNTLLMMTHYVEAVLPSNRIGMMTNGPTACVGGRPARPLCGLEATSDPIDLKCRQRVLEFPTSGIASSRRRELSGLSARNCETALRGRPTP